MLNFLVHLDESAFKAGHRLERWWWWLCYMGGGLLQLFGFFKNHSQLGPKSTRQYCISSKVPVTGQPGWPMTLTAHTQLEHCCHALHHQARQPPRQWGFLPAPHPSTLIQQQCSKYLRKADATCAQSNAFQAHVITSSTSTGTGIHATMCDLHIRQE